MRRTSRTRRHLRRAGGGERIDPADVFERDGWVCGICRKKIRRGLRHPDGGSASLDHIVPLSRGGRHVRENVQAAHLFCNLSKHDRAVGSQLRLVG